MIVYKITNLVNGKVYIGQTIRSMSARFRQHNSPKSGCSSIYNAIVKYGFFNFTIEQIDSANSISELNAKEEYWIKYYDSMDRDKGYNLTSGGYNKTLSESTKEKLRLANLGKKYSEKTRIKQSLARKGKKLKPCSDEHRLKLSLLAKGRRHTEESKLKMSVSRKGKSIPSLKGRHVSELTKSKIAASLRGKKRPPGVMENCIKAHKGAKRSQKSKEAMRLAWIKRKQTKALKQEAFKAAHGKRVVAVSKVTGEVFHFRSILKCSEYTGLNRDLIRGILNKEKDHYEWNIYSDDEKKSVF